MEIPRIVGGSSSTGANDALLRKRIHLEHELARAATAARAKQAWQEEWRRKTLPMQSVVAPTPAPTAAVYSPLAVTSYWATPTVFGWRRDRFVWTGHAIAAAVHLALCLTCAIVSSQAIDPTLRLSRSQFIFTRNNSECGVLTNWSGVEADHPIAVLTPVATFHVGAASAAFFGLSFLAHSIWVLAGLWDPLGALLFGWLQDCWAPVRWIEYTVRHARTGRGRCATSLTCTRVFFWGAQASASLMLSILVILSGGRDRAYVAAVFVLTATTMLHGLFTELGSRPDENSNGELWRGDRPDRSNRFRAFCVRMIPHLAGFLPYGAAA